MQLITGIFMDGTSDVMKVSHWQRCSRTVSRIEISGVRFVLLGQRIRFVIILTRI